MTTRDNYNGWTNYETWNWSLWNDFYTLAEDFEHLLEEDEAAAIAEIAETLKDQTEEDAPWNDQHTGSASGASFYNDIAGAALSQVNWNEIARHVWEELNERAENDDL